MSRLKMRGGIKPKKAPNRYGNQRKDPLKGYNPSGMKLNLQEGAHLPEVVLASLLNNVLQGLIKARNNKFAENANADLKNDDSKIDFLQEQLKEAKSKLRPGELENYQEFKKVLKETVMIEEYLSSAKNKKNELEKKEIQTVEDNIVISTLQTEIDISLQSIKENKDRLVEISKILGFEDIDTAKTYLFSNAPAQERVQTILTELDKTGIENLLTIRCEDNIVNDGQNKKEQLKGALEDIADNNKLSSIEQANTDEIAQTLEAIPTIATEIVADGIRGSADSLPDANHSSTKKNGLKL